MGRGQRRVTAALDPTRALQSPTTQQLQSMFDEFDGAHVDDDLILTLTDRADRTQGTFLQLLLSGTGEYILNIGMGPTAGCTFDTTVASLAEAREVAGRWLDGEDEALVPGWHQEPRPDAPAPQPEARSVSPRQRSRKHRFVPAVGTTRCELCGQAEARGVHHLVLDASARRTAAAAGTGPAPSSTTPSRAPASQPQSPPARNWPVSRVIGVLVVLGVVLACFGCDLPSTSRCAGGEDLVLIEDGRGGEQLACV